MQETPVRFLGWEDPLEKGKTTHSSILGLHSWASLVAQLVKNPHANAGDLGSIPVLGRSPGEGKGYPLQYAGLGNSMDCIVHRVAKSQTRLRDFHFHYENNAKLQLVLQNTYGCNQCPRVTSEYSNRQVSRGLILFHKRKKKAILRFIIWPQI